jgi:cell fate regulator YaaT (PSP1 superfamily)
MANLVGVRFREAGKVFYYDAGELDLPVGIYVVVETAHGLAVGRVVIAPDQVIANESSSGDDLKPVLRLATAEDLEKRDELRARASEDLRRAKAMASELGLDMSINAGEYDLEGNAFTAYFTSSERIDFRNLVRDLSREIGARVQLLQVGDRDRAKLVDGVDICGERLCCSSWMTNFPSVSIRMAKEQDLPLNPQKISGVCGRLYCCLTFEYEDYRALRGTLPKVGSFISTPAGEARVTGIDFNREVVKLYLTEERTPIEVAAIDFRLQNGVTIRPMELVRKIEGPMRTISEDSESRGRRPERGRQRDRGPARERPDSRSPAPAPPRPEPPVANVPAPQNAAADSAEPGAQRRRRRRRRRGRGAGDGAGPAAPNGE